MFTLTILPPVLNCPPSDHVPHDRTAKKYMYRCLTSESSKFPGEPQRKRYVSFLIFLHIILFLANQSQAMIRLTCSDRSAPITFDFAKDFTSRDAIRDILNRLKSNVAKTPTTASAVSDSVALPAKPVSPEERRWRSKLLSFKDVRRLHQRVVLSGATTDDQFWNALKYRFKANGERRASQAEVDEVDEVNLQNGVPSNAFPAEQRTVIDTSKWGAIPTPAQRHQVFMEHAYMKQALDSLTPEMTEERVWELFQISSMALRRGRLSKRDTAMTAEADAVFAPFQAGGREASENEKLKRIEGLATGLAMDRFDDHRMQHVLEGHGGGWDAPRVATRVKGNVTEGLRFVRMVNRHGGLILEEGGDVNWNDCGVKGRPLEDLEIEAERTYAKLAVDSDADGLGKHDGDEVVADDIVGQWHFADEMEDGMEWGGDFTRFEYEIEGCGEVLGALLDRMQP